MSSTSKSALNTFLTQIPTQIFGVVSGIFITRMIGAEGRGLYAIFHADLSLFSTILGLSISTTVTYFIANKKLPKHKIIGVAFIFSLFTIFSSIILLLTWLNMPFADILIPTEQVTIMLIGLFVSYIVLNQITTLYSAFFQGIKNFKVINRVMLINSLFNILLFGLAFILHYNNITKIGLYQVLAIGAIIIFFNTLQWHYHYKKNHTYNFTFKLRWKEEIKPFLTFMGLGHLSSIINFFNYRLVLWIMAYYLDNAQVGFFSLAFGLTLMLTLVSNPLAQVLFPVLCSSDEKDRSKTFVLFSKAHFSILTVAVIFSLIVSPFLIPKLYGVEFQNSIIPFTILIFPTLLSCQTKIFTSFLFSESKVSAILLATIVGFVFTLSLSFPLIKEFGIIGASITSSITYISIFIYIYIYIIFKHKKSSKNLFILSFQNIRDAKKQFKTK